MPLTDLNAEADARLNRPLARIDFPVDAPSDFTRLKEIWMERRMIPVLLLDRNEGVDVSVGGRDSRLLLSGDESAGRYCIEDVIYAPGYDFPAYHMEEAEEHLYVLDGELEVTVGNRTERCTKGSFAFIPRNVTRRLLNVSDRPASVFQWSNPAGHDRALIELAKAHKATGQLSPEDTAAILGKYRIVVHHDNTPLPGDADVNRDVEHMPYVSRSLDDFMLLREIWATKPMAPKIIHDVSQSWSVDVIPDTGTYCILRGDECGGRAMVLVNDLPPGLAVAPHYQPTEEECFFALEEGLWWRVGGKKIETKIGSFAFAPRFCTHQFGNATDTRKTFLTINSPAGHERALDAVKTTDITQPENQDFMLWWGWNVHEEIAAQ